MKRFYSCQIYDYIDNKKSITLRDILAEARKVGIDETTIKIGTKLDYSGCYYLGDDPDIILFAEGELHEN